MPSGLKETKLVVSDEDKPAALCLLLRELQGIPTIVFVSSIDATGALAALLGHVHRMVGQIGNVVEYSAASSVRDRQAALARFKNSEATIMVCSDAMTRGIDVKGVDAVINYDAPVYPKTYVHRAGRTARAGRTGKVITILRREDVRHFKSMLRKADNNYVKDEALDRENMAEARQWVVQGLSAMKQDQENGLHVGDEQTNAVYEPGTRKKNASRKRKKIRGKNFHEILIA